MSWSVALFGELKWTARSRAAFENSVVSAKGLKWPVGFATKTFASAASADPLTIHAVGADLNGYA